MNPTMSSPGTGVQHLASFTQMSFGLNPATMIASSPEIPERDLTDPGVTPSESVSSVPSPPPRLSTSFDTTFCGEMWPSPTAA